MTPIAHQQAVTVRNWIASICVATADICEVEYRHVRRRLDRQQCHVTARHVAMFLVRRHVGLTTGKIAKAFGYREHSAVLHALRTIEAEVELGRGIAGLVRAVELRIGIRAVA